MAPIPHSESRPPALDLLCARLPLHLRQRATSYPHGELSVAQQRVVERNDRRGVADEQDALVPAVEAALDLGHEGLEEPGGAVVALPDVFAFARGVPDRLPGRVDLGEPLLQDLWLCGTWVQPCVGLNVRVPFRQSWTSLFRVDCIVYGSRCVPCSAYIGTFNVTEMGLHVWRHRSFE